MIRDEIKNVVLEIIDHYETGKDYKPVDSLVEVFKEYIETQRVKEEILKNCKCEGGCILQSNNETLNDLLEGLEKEKNHNA